VKRLGWRTQINANIIKEKDNFALAQFKYSELTRHWYVSWHILIAHSKKNKVWLLRISLLQNILNRKCIRWMYTWILTDVHKMHFHKAQRFILSLF
jgi:hypothetical protein